MHTLLLGALLLTAPPPARARQATATIDTRAQALRALATQARALLSAGAVELERTNLGREIDLATRP